MHILLTHSYVALSSAPKRRTSPMKDFGVALVSLEFK